MRKRNFLVMSIALGALVACGEPLIEDMSGEISNDGTPTPTEVDPTPTPTDEETPTPTPPAPSFAADVLPIITANCDGACHGTTAALADQFLTYSDIATDATARGTDCDGRQRIVPGNAAGSVLFSKIDPDTLDLCGAPMPYLRTALTTDEIATIGAWIDAGALND